MAEFGYRINIKGSVNMKNTKKKMVTSALILTSVFSVICAGVSADDITIYIDGSPVAGCKAYIDENDRTQATVREICEAMGCEVDWSEASRIVTITNGEYELSMTIGDNKIYDKDGNFFEMDTEARIVGDKTYIPVRFIAELFGFNVEYNGTDRAVNLNIKSGGVEYIGMLTQENTNPRGLFWQDFSSINPNKLTDVWYTSDAIPEEITEALNKGIGYTGEQVTAANAKLHLDPAQAGSYDLANGAYKQTFVFDKTYQLVYIDKELRSNTGRIAILIESDDITSDDLWLGADIYEMAINPNGVNQAFYRES